MTDEPIFPSRPPHAAPIEHHCIHPGCSKWGGFGFDRYQGGVKMTDWWCWEHYPYKDWTALKGGRADAQFLNCQPSYKLTFPEPRYLQCVLKVWEGLQMQEEKQKVPSSRESRDKRKAETDRAYREMEEKDRRERLEKTKRLRKMRLVKDTQSE